MSTKESQSNQYYLQDSRDFVGNDMLFWRLGGGYTTDVSQAEIFTKESALKQHRDRETDVPWAVEYIDGITRPAVDVQYADKDFSLAGER